MKSLAGVLEFGVLTDPGMVRTNNEDAVFVDSALGLALLADGMGGGNAGEVASGMATTLLATELTQHLGGRPAREIAGAGGTSPVFGLLRQRIEAANRAIFQTAEHQPQYAGMGTTLVAALFYASRVTVAHVGDSRAYRLRAGELEPLTTDHSLVQMQLEAGLISAEEARTSKQKNIVTRALGIEADVEPELHEHPVQRGDVYLLCSDGLHDLVDAKDIVATLQRPGPLQSAAQQLVKIANDNGGRDNISVILVKVLADFGAPQGWWERVRAWAGR